MIEGEDLKVSDCVFCEMPVSAYVIENDYFYGLFDKYPVTEGHLLIIPKRHAETLFELTKDALCVTIVVVDH